MNDLSNDGEHQKFKLYFIQFMGMQYIYIKFGQQDLTLSQS